MQAGGLSSRSSPTEELYISDYLACCALSAWQGCAGRGAYRLLILILALIGAICFAMARPVSLAVALAAASLAIGTASPIMAQSGEQQPPQPRTVYVPGRGTVLVQPVPTDDPRAVARTVIVPGYGEVYAVPVLPKDTRSARQRCVDEEVAREGGSPSALAMRAIDLKCSQR